jgi:hypothetical protein
MSLKLLELEGILSFPCPAMRKLVCRGGWLFAMRMMEGWLVLSLLSLMIAGHNHIMASLVASRMCNRQRGMMEVK